MAEMSLDFPELNGEGMQIAQDSSPTPFTCETARLAAPGTLISESALRVEHDLFPILIFGATTA